MKFLEYQAKEVFAAAGIPTPKGKRGRRRPKRRGRSPKSWAAPSSSRLRCLSAAGARPGGVAVVKSAAEAEKEAERILSMEIRGYPVDEVLIEKAADIKAEFYLGVTVDRARQAPVLIVSSAGGMDIEEVAETHPDKVAKVWIDPLIGLRPFQVRGGLLPGAGRLPS